jgi:hypothetical protein
LFFIEIQGIEKRKVCIGAEFKNKCTQIRKHRIEHNWNTRTQGGFLQTAFNFDARHQFIALSFQGHQEKWKAFMQVETHTSEHNWVKNWTNFGMIKNDLNNPCLLSIDQCKVSQSYFSSALFWIFSAKQSFGRLGDITWLAEPANKQENTSTAETFAEAMPAVEETDVTKKLDEFLKGMVRVLAITHRNKQLMIDSTPFCVLQIKSQGGLGLDRLEKLMKQLDRG